jgi:hypothetical protein
MPHHEQSQLYGIVQYIGYRLQALKLFIFDFANKFFQMVLKKKLHLIFNKETQIMEGIVVMSSTAAPPVVLISPPPKPAEKKKKLEPWIASIPKTLPRGCVHCEVINARMILYVMELKEGKYKILYNNLDDGEDQNLTLAWPNTIWLITILNGIPSYIYLCGTKDPFEKHELDTELYVLPMPNQMNNCHGNLCTGGLPRTGDPEDNYRIRDGKDIETIMSSLMLTQWNEDISPDYSDYGFNDFGPQQWHEWSKRIKRPQTAYSKYKWVLKNFWGEEGDGEGESSEDPHKYKSTISGFIEMLKGEDNSKK